MTPRLTASDQRALALVLDGTIVEDTRARVFTHTDHRAVLSGDGSWSCTCEARPANPCFVVKAVALIIQREEAARGGREPWNIRVLPKPDPGPVAA